MAIQHDCFFCFCFLGRAQNRNLLLISKLVGTESTMFYFNRIQGFIQGIAAIPHIELRMLLSTPQLLMSVILAFCKTNYKMVIFHVAIPIKKNC